MNPTTPAVPDLAEEVFNYVYKRVLLHDKEAIVSGLRSFLATQPAPSGDAVEVLRKAIETVCEGWNLPFDARKILESALWSPEVATSRAATVAKADGKVEPEHLSTDQSREYLVTFMEQHFTDKTYHRYIRGERGSVNLAGDFAWQMARALRLLATPKPEASAANQQAGEVSVSDKQAIEGFDQVMQERDHYHEMADKLAEQIAAITATDIGEHSSSNCPWESALQACDEYWALASKPFAAPISEGTGKPIAIECDRVAHEPPQGADIPTCPSHQWQPFDDILVDAYTAGSEGGEVDLIACRRKMIDALRPTAVMAGGLPPLPPMDHIADIPGVCRVVAYSANAMHAYVLADRAVRAGTGSAGKTARECFEKYVGPRLDYTLVRDDWGHPIYKAPHVESIYYGWKLCTESRATKVEAAPGNAGEGEV